MGAKNLHTQNLKNNGSVKSGSHILQKYIHKQHGSPFRQLFLIIATFLTISDVVEASSLNPGICRLQTSQRDRHYNPCPVAVLESLNC